MSQPCQASHRPGRGGPRTPRPHLPPFPSPTEPPSGLQQQQEPGRPPESERQERPGWAQAPWPRPLTTPLHPLSVWWTSLVPRALPGGQVPPAPPHETDRQAGLSLCPLPPLKSLWAAGGMLTSHRSSVGHTAGPEPPALSPHNLRLAQRLVPCIQAQTGRRWQSRSGVTLERRTGQGQGCPSRCGGPGGAAPPGALPLTRTRGDQRHAALRHLEPWAQIPTRYAL